MSAEPIARQELRSFIERIERLEEEKAAIASDIKDVKAEAKGRGYDVTAINAIIKLRKKDANERMEQEAILATYMAALGMIPEFEADEPHDPQTGEVFDQPTRTSGPRFQQKSASASQLSETNTPSDAAPRLDNTVSPDSAGEADAPTHGLPTNSPETANEVQHPGSRPDVGNPEPALAAATRPNGDDGMVRTARTEAAAVTDRRDDHLISPEEAEEMARYTTRGTGGSPAALVSSPATGGEDVTGAENAQPDNGPGNVSISRAKTIRDYRPHCLRPEACASNFIDKHCYSCERASREEVDA